MQSLPFSTVMRSSPVTPLMSTRCFGRASRNAMVGTRLCPPASTRPSSLAYRASRSSVSAMVLGAWYWNGAGFIAPKA